jgi:thiol-disulfide isomerase/thioredoxin
MSNYLNVKVSIGCLAGAWFAFAAVSASAQAPPNFIQHNAPKPTPELQFRDGHGQERSLGDFRGKVVLLNIWATWCGPCRREMPSLDRLQANWGGPDFEVVALSIDRAGTAVIEKFYVEHALRNLAIYNDDTGKASRTLGAIGVPATLLLGRDGKELGRLIGPAEWDEPGVVGFLARVISSRAGETRAEVHLTPNALGEQGRKP